MKLTVDGNRVGVSGRELLLPHKVVDARQIGQRVIVLFDYMEFDQSRPARNLFAYTSAGAETWRAGDIECGSADAFTNFISEEPLVVGNFAGYTCQIDPQSGAVLEAMFTK